jgi:hypothetical protein
VCADHFALDGRALRRLGNNRQPPSTIVQPP